MWKKVAMINQEEYEVLKALDDKWKWIARDRDVSGDVFSEDELWVYIHKPERQPNFWRMGEAGEISMLPYNDLFQFIQWDDSEPYSIAELIEEYESEESEVKKNVEWLKGEMDSMHRKRDLDRNPDEWFISKTALLKAIDQLDEPERSPEVDQHKELLDELNDLYARKNQDYGNSFDDSLDEDGLLVLKIRLGDKYKRFSTLIKQEQEVDDESMRDTLVDLANYALMGVMWMDKNEEEE